MRAHDVLHMLRAPAHTYVLLNRDGEFLDARCALVAFLYASGRRAEAEGQWEALQQAQGAAICGYPRLRLRQVIMGVYPNSSAATILLRLRHPTVMLLSSGTSNLGPCVGAVMNPNSL